MQAMHIYQFLNDFTSMKIAYAMQGRACAF
jgi:hypothetical protein